MVNKSRSAVGAKPHTLANEFCVAVGAKPHNLRNKSSSAGGAKPQTLIFFLLNGFVVSHMNM